MTDLPVKWRDGGFQEMGGEGGSPSNGVIILKWGVDTTLLTMKLF